MSQAGAVARRAFLQRAAGATAVMGFAGFGAFDELLAGLDPPAPSARLAGTVEFVGEGRPPLGRPFGAGLAGRQVLDLSRLDRDALVVPNDAFFIRTRYPRSLDPMAPWSVSLRARAVGERRVGVGELAADAGPMGVHVIECSGNGPRRRFGLVSAARWDGVPVTALLARLGAVPEGDLVRVTGFDEHVDLDPGSVVGASWIFQPRQLLERRAFLATGMNGAPLPPDHGFPVRLVVPGWYGCTCIKWVNRIEYVDGAIAPTPHMREYAGRTHQRGVPSLARDYRPAAVDVAAVPVRVELWRAGGRPIYRVVGVVWGGERAPAALEIRFHDKGAFRPVDAYQPYPLSGWSLWSARWRPTRPGHHRIRLRVPDPGVSSRRLDAGYYSRAVIVIEL